MNQKKVSFSKFFESNKSAFFKSQVNKFTEKKYFRRILIVIKTFPGFPSLGVQNCFLFKVKVLVLSNSVFPELKIRERFY